MVQEEQREAWAKFVQNVWYQNCQAENISSAHMVRLGFVFLT